MRIGVLCIHKFGQDLELIWYTHIYTTEVSNWDAVKLLFVTKGDESYTPTGIRSAFYGIWCFVTFGADFFKVVFCYKSDNSTYYNITDVCTQQVCVQLTIIFHLSSYSESQQTVCLLLSLVIIST